MVQIRSRLDVADNSGARMATMIGVIGKQTRHAGIGEVTTANVKEASPTGTVKKGEIARGSRSHEAADPARVRLAAPL